MTFVVDREPFLALKRVPPAAGEQYLRSIDIHTASVPEAFSSRDQFLSGQGRKTAAPEEYPPA
jgi:hypothetical protein